MNRVNKIILVLGKRGTGKTTYIKEVLVNTKFYEKVLIVDTFANPMYNEIPEMKMINIKNWKKGTYRIYDSNTEDMLNEIESHIKNSLIIFEDSVKYINKVLQSSVRKIVIDSKQKNNDVIFIFHGFASTPPELFRLSDLIVMFRTDDPHYRKNEIIEFDAIEQAYNQISKSKNQFDKKIIQLH